GVISCQDARRRGPPSWRSRHTSYTQAGLGSAAPQAFGLAIQGQGHLPRAGAHRLELLQVIIVERRVRRRPPPARQHPAHVLAVDHALYGRPSSRERRERRQQVHQRDLLGAVAPAGSAPTYPIPICWPTHTASAPLKWISKNLLLITGPPWPSGFSVHWATTFLLATSKTSPVSHQPYLPSRLKQIQPCVLAAIGTACLNLGGITVLSKMCISWFP